MPSTYTKILNDVNGLVSLANPLLNRVVRKEIKKLEGDSLPLAIIIPSLQATADEAFEGQIQIDFEVGIAILFAGNLRLETGLADMIDTIDQIRNLVDVTSLPTASTSDDPCGVFDSNIDLNPPYDTSAIEKNIDYSLMKITYRSMERRN